MLEPLETALFCKSLNCRAWLRLKWAHWQWASKMPGRGQFADLAILDHKGNQSTQLTRSMSQCPCKNFDAAGHSHPSTQIPSAPLKKCDRTFLESTFVFSCSFPRQGVRGSLNSSRCRVSVTWHPSGLSFFSKRLMSSFNLFKSLKLKTQETSWKNYASLAVHWKSWKHPFPSFFNIPGNEHHEHESEQKQPQETVTLRCTRRWHHTLQRHPICSLSRFGSQVWMPYFISFLFLDGLQASAGGMQGLGGGMRE